MRFRIYITLLQKRKLILSFKMEKKYVKELEPFRVSVGGKTYSCLVKHHWPGGMECFISRVIKWPLIGWEFELLYSKFVFSLLGRGFIIEQGVYYVEAGCMKKVIENYLKYWGEKSPVVESSINVVRSI